MDEVGRDDRDRAWIGRQFGTEHLLDLLEDLPRAAAGRVDAEALCLWLVGDLLQLVHLIAQVRAAGELARQVPVLEIVLEARPGIVVAVAGWVDPQQLLDRPGGLTMPRTVDEEVSSAQWV